MLTELSRLIDVQEIDKVIQEVTQGLARLPEAVSYTHLTLPTNREV